MVFPSSVLELPFWSPATRHLQGWSNLTSHFQNQMKCMQPKLLMVKWAARHGTARHDYNTYGAAHLNICSRNQRCCKPAASPKGRAEGSLSRSVERLEVLLRATLRSMSVLAEDSKSRCAAFYQRRSAEPRHPGDSQIRMGSGGVT